MRSRYSAYTQANIDYIQNSMSGKAAEDYDPISSKQWAESVSWLGLTVKKSYLDKSDSELGYVEFIAKFRDSAEVEQELAELSEFRKINGQWFYYDGIISAKSMNSVYTKETLTNASALKVGRNISCPCGSGKKFKKCCY